MRKLPSGLQAVAARLGRGWASGRVEPGWQQGFLISSGMDSDGGLMAYKSFPQWSNLFQLNAYLQEDWSCEYDTWEDAVDDFIDGYVDVDKVPGEIEGVLESFPLEMLNRRLYDDVRLYYRRDTNQETADWLRAVAARIRARLGEAGSSNQSSRDV